MVFEIYPAVNEQRMMDSGYDRNFEGLEEQKPISQALIIMDDIESLMLHKFYHFFEGTQAKCSHFRKGTKSGCHKFIKMEGIKYLERVVRGQESCFAPPKIEIRDFVYGDAI
jgi:hypothetical protein